MVLNVINIEFTYPRISDGYPNAIRTLSDTIDSVFYYLFPQEMESKLNKNISQHIWRIDNILHKV